ncbi:MAG TPA: hypothetical protein VFD58_32005, partial [Blastocatellia bacterium]|nr:hypothetical protein [Blastocatellia bacterium]
MKTQRRHKTRLVRLLILIASISLLSLSAGARPEYLRLFAADPTSRPEWRQKCSTCHLNPQGGGERNSFGKAFEASGFRITDGLRRQFPDRFLLPESTQSAPPVSFVRGSDSQVVVEVNGRKFLIDTRSRSVTEVAAGRTPETAAAAPAPQPSPSPAPQAEAKVYQPIDVRLVSLPTARPIPRHSLWVDFTHRFPFGEFDVNDPAGLFGLDGFAVPSFGLIYGLTNRLH